ncbi:hypothetical protein Desde_1155 [Desulfitobacterium dehalogenans ATCC 51507]|uniref:Potassium channel domain-containing protein n=1 Tax=Desulfitobacterium dehalogenans (strain ATCC 51507 / DSM 9161 / JW/IU-DC1) TaxID=756499 RepID=I4A6K0_DESDJ|nr:hypothetical protein [Desulfitobacterium dehalogenans]AFL99584.1 hypothetical protein Desde_1155 [Desulfitobacterium dehalogenans ATCC 51507]
MYGGPLGDYSSRSDSYFSSYPRPSFLGHTKRVTPILSPEAEQPNEKIAASLAARSNVWLLVPAMAGTVAYYLFTSIFRGVRREEKEGKSASGKIGSVVFTSIVTLGLASYIYSVLVLADGHLMDVYWSITGTIAVQMLYFAAVYTWLYRLDESSFDVKVEDDPIEEFITFLYFSITTFATTGSSVFPESITARILVAIQVLFLVFSFSMGLVFFTSP